MLIILLYANIRTLQLKPAQTKEDFYYGKLLQRRYPLQEVLRGWLAEWPTGIYIPNQTRLCCPRLLCLCCSGSSPCLSGYVPALAHTCALLGPLAAYCARLDSDIQYDAEHFAFSLKRESTIKKETVVKTLPVDVSSFPMKVVIMHDYKTIYRGNMLIIRAGTQARIMKMPVLNSMIIDNNGQPISVGLRALLSIPPYTRPIDVPFNILRIMA